MFHTGTRRLIDYWGSLRRDGGAPDRADFHPCGLGSLLPQAFIVGRGERPLAVRLAGEALVDLHGRSLKGQGYLTFWEPPSRAAVRDAVAGAVKGRRPVVLYADARRASGERVTAEIAMAPLVGAEGRIDRLVGLYQPLGEFVAKRDDPIAPLAAQLTVYAGADSEGRSQIRLAAVDGLRIA